MTSDVSFGWCRPFADAPLLARLGFDHIELPLAEQMIEADAGAFSSHLLRLVQSPLPIRAFNYLFPRDIRIVGPDITDRDRLERYYGRMAEIVGRVGAKAVVLGSAWARNVPAGYNKATAHDEFETALERMAEHMRGTGGTVVIEPLYRQESNIINSVSEGAAIAARVNRSEIRVLADFFHMDEEREPLTTLYDNRACLAHVHLADTGRRHPGSGTYPYAQFFACLHKAGYRGTMSAECTVSDIALDAAYSLQFLRRQWAHAKREVRVKHEDGK